jgi:hypothetical protein
MRFDVNEAVPGMFVRVDLQAGLIPQGSSCYASELTYTAAIPPGRGLEMHATGFVKAPLPGSSCDGPTFQSNIAEVRVFATANTFAQSPVAGGNFSVAVTVTE